MLGIYIFLTATRKQKEFVRRIEHKFFLLLATNCIQPVLNIWVASVSTFCIIPFTFLENKKLAIYLKTQSNNQTTKANRLYVRYTPPTNIFSKSFFAYTLQRNIYDRLTKRQNIGVVYIVF